MAIVKKFLKTKAACKVKFTLEPEHAVGAKTAFLVGTFNDWSETAHPMKKTKQGGFSLEIELPSGQDHEFRYLLDSGTWCNDSAADHYSPCPFSGQDNSVVKV